MNLRKLQTFVRRVGALAVFLGAGLGAPAMATTCTSVPNIAVNGVTIVDATTYNANFAWVVACANAIDNSNVSGLGFYASQIIPTTVGQATFGGAQTYTFNAGISSVTASTSVTPIIGSSPSGTTVDLIQSFVNGVKKFWVSSAGVLNSTTAAIGTLTLTNPLGVAYGGTGKNTALVNIQNIPLFTNISLPSGSSQYFAAFDFTRVTGSGADIIGVSIACLGGSAANVTTTMTATKNGGTTSILSGASQSFSGSSGATSLSYFISGGGWFGGIPLDQVAPQYFNFNPNSASGGAITNCSAVAVVALKV